MMKVETEFDTLIPFEDFDLHLIWDNNFYCDRTLWYLFENWISMVYQNFTKFPILEDIYV